MEAQKKKPETICIQGAEKRRITDPSDLSEHNIQI